MSPGTIGYEIDSLGVELGGRSVLRDLALRVPDGAFTGVLGPNGSGKTTLLKILTGALRPASGAVRLNGRNISDYGVDELARHVGIVPQQFTLDFGFTVEEMVEMGRYASSSPVRRDREAVSDALATVGLTELASRLVTELSGGERQRALIAQTLAQDTPVLLLDEPLNNLDLNHQLETMQLLARLHDSGRTIVVVLHDLNMAAQYCDELVLLDGGRVAAKGPPDEILDPRLILDVFHARVAVHHHGRRPYITPQWSQTAAPAPASHVPVHVVAGGGAASPILETLVRAGVAPTVGIVSVFDSDYATASRFDLKVISSPPFQAFTDDALARHAALVRRAKVVVVAPVFFGRGNLEVLRSALEAVRQGKIVLVVTEPPIVQRDLAEGQALELHAQLLDAGAVAVSSEVEALARIRELMAGPTV